MIYPDTMKNEYDAFVTGMVTEYNRHWNKNGDSWKIMKPFALYDLMVDNITSFKDLMSNPNHLFDIANYAMFLWYNIMKETDVLSESSIICKECGEWIKKEEYDLHLAKTRPDIIVDMLNGLREQIKIRDDKIKQHEVQRRAFISKISDLLSRLPS